MAMPERSTRNRLLRLVRDNLLLILIVAVIGGAYLFLRTPESSVRSLAALDEALAGGRPTLLEFYSNGWSSCLVAKPVVDRLERELAEQVQVLRLSVYGDAGRAAAGRYAVRAVPSFVVFDAEGTAVAQSSGLPDGSKLRELLGSLAAEAGGWVRKLRSLSRP
jgi:thiol-disulfide isomerase/thioredoxin